MILNICNYELLSTKFDTTKMVQEQDESLTLREKCLYSELFWSVFFRIATFYTVRTSGEREACGQLLVKSS